MKILGYHDPIMSPPAIVEVRRSPSHEEFMALARVCREQMDVINKLLERCLCSETKGG